MKYTFNGCSRSNFAVNPANWNTARASLRKPWRIFYRFYDPTQRDEYPGGKDIPLRGMNAYKTREERRLITRQLLDNEEYLIDVLGYNPITKEYMGEIAPAEKESSIPKASEITGKTPVLLALTGILSKVTAEPDTITDIKSMLKYFGESAKLLSKDHIPLKDLKRGDIMNILDNIANLTVTEKRKEGWVTRPKVWTANQFNHYRKYLSLLFAPLEMMEIIDYNPIEKIPKAELPEGTEVKSRITLTDEQAKLIDREIRAKDIHFHKFIHIFYHGGSRRKEMMRLQGKDVDLEGQRFRVFVKKRKKKNRVWEWKTIKNIALPYWQAAMEGCQPEQYVFSKGLVPGDNYIRPEQVTRRWARHVKTLGIKADFYALKHRNTTIMINKMMEFLKRKEEAQKLAARHNAHKNHAMVVQIYDTDEAERIHQEVKRMNNVFGG